MTVPRILIIAGSDSGGGAGIQADIKTVTMLGGHAMTAITAITAQNTLGVDAVMPVPTEMVLAQIDAVASDIGVDGVKIGMIGSAETAQAVADRLERIDVPIVFDPVMVATSGSVLADEPTIAAFDKLLAIATVATPNTPELGALAGTEIKNEVDQEDAADAIMERTGCPAILAKGGHWPEDWIEAPAGQILDALYLRSDQGHWSASNWASPRLKTRNTHGTGCTLASATATFLGRGLSLAAAIARARQFVLLALREAPGFGSGHGPMGHQKVRLDLGGELRLNQVTLPASDLEASYAFYVALGLTPVVHAPPRYARFECEGGATLSIETGLGEPSGAGVYLECTDLDAVVAGLRGKGIEIDDPVEQSWRWREAWLRDPAGNRLCLYQADLNRRYPPWRLSTAK